MFEGSPNTLPSAEYLRERLTDALRWKWRPRSDFATDRAWRTWNSRFAGKLAGCFDGPHGAHVIRLNGVKYQAHRVLWKILTGEEPPPTIDHKNRDPGDNRFANLRPATMPEQGWNRRMQSNNTSGYRGVSLRKKNGKWAVRLKVDGVYRSYGEFASREEAGAVADAVRRKHHGEFYCEG